MDPKQPQPQKPPITKALAPVDELCMTLDKMAPDFKTLLPANVTPEKFMRTLKTAIRTTPKLVACNRQSLYSEAMKCAQDGLLPDGREAALVPFGKEEPVAKYMPMVGGICKRARNSGEIVTIDALVVYEKDDYKAWIDERGPHFKHVKFRGDRGKPILVYSYAITRDGGLYFEEIDAATVEKIKAMAMAKAGGKDTPWKGPFEDEMWRKSALHRLCKYRLPSSSDMEEVLARDADLYQSNEERQAEKPKQEEATKPRRTGAIIEGQLAEERPAEPQPEPAREAKEEPSEQQDDGGGEQVPI